MADPTTFFSKLTFKKDTYANTTDPIIAIRKNKFEVDNNKVDGTDSDLGYDPANPPLRRLDPSSTNKYARRTKERLIA